MREWFSRVWNAMWNKPLVTIHLDRSLCHPGAMLEIPMNVEIVWNEEPRLARWLALGCDIQEDKLVYSYFIGTAKVIS